MIPRRQTKEDTERMLKLTHRQWQDLIDVTIYGLSRAMKMWIDECTVKDMREANKRVRFIVDLMQSDWWYPGGGSLPVRHKKKRVVTNPVTGKVYPSKRLRASTVRKRSRDFGKRRR